ncbi:MAG TPA: NAD(P)H-dependent oxidoreductase [Candidatus Saccharimonadales bacterium]|nr:NAD(P)H-dependent oxidoreductase [Candidatus Saccharimonadales bacterium]
MVNIKVILGSTRPGRFGIQPATWITELGKQYKDANFELVDLKEVDLPLLDVPAPPSMVPSNQNAHQEAWAKIVGEADGFIFVTAEYNHGVPGAFKNAVDFVAHEWGNKPVAFVSYGADAGGVRAIEQWRQIVAWLKMYDLQKFVHFPNYFTSLNDKGEFQFTDEHAERAHGMLKDLVFWAEQMKEARAKLQ